MIYLCLLITLCSSARYSSIEATHRNDVGGYWQMQVNNNSTNQFIQTFTHLMGTFRGITSYVQLTNSQVKVRLYCRNSHLQAILNKYIPSDNAVTLSSKDQLDAADQLSINLTIGIKDLHNDDTIQMSDTNISFKILEAESEIQKRSKKIHSYQTILNQIIKNESISVYINKINNRIELTSQQFNLIISQFPKIMPGQTICINLLIILCTSLAILVDFNQRINKLQQFQPKLEMVNILFLLYAISHLLEWSKIVPQSGLSFLEVMQIIMTQILGVAMLIFIFPFSRCCRDEKKEKIFFIYRIVICCLIVLMNYLNHFILLLAVIFDIYQLIRTLIIQKRTLQLQISYLLSVIVFISYYTYLNTLTIMRIPFDDSTQLPLIISVFVMEAIIIFQNYTKFLQQCYRKYKAVCKRYYIHLKSIKKGYKKIDEFCCLCLEKLQENQIDFELASGQQVSKIGKTKVLTAQCNHVMHRQCLQENIEEITQCPIDGCKWGEELKSECK